MQTFLDKSLEHILYKHNDLSQVVIVFPSKRAVGVFKNKLKNASSKTTFFPKIQSIESFLEDISGLSSISGAHLLFKSYKAYLTTKSFKVKDDFLTFSSWISSLLSDFNEIDKYLASPKLFFSYLKNVQEINQWAHTSSKTQLVTNYLQFWDALPDFYKKLQEVLLQSNQAYQGLLSRKATEDIEHYIFKKGKQPHYFIGFNALTKAEELIFQELLETGNTTILWDADNYFINDKDHSASHFMNAIFTQWKYYQSNKPKWIFSNYSSPKDIAIIEATKNISQVKYIGELLSTFSQQQLNNTVIVLADETLLKPLLFSLPKNCTQVNVTMGLTIKNQPVFYFIKSLLELQLNRKDEKLYYKDVLKILNHPLLNHFDFEAQNLKKTINQKNYTYLNPKQLAPFFKDSTPEAKVLFKKWDSQKTISVIIKVIDFLKDKRLSKQDLATLFKLNAIFKTLEEHENELMMSIQIVYQLVSELANTTTIDIEGNPKEGLQIMGLLETRVLDFETVIIAGVNEGILPLNKTTNTFIPYDLKKEFGLPLQAQKETIFTYHFYRLISRAKDVTLLYNSITTGIEKAEKSRFIFQLEHDNISAHTIKHIVLTPSLKTEKQHPITVFKNKDVLECIKKKGAKGFSPSSFLKYIKNPIDFYNATVLGIKENQFVEENIQANTFGTIIHNILENLYKPLLNRLLTKEILFERLNNITNETTKEFLNHFPKETLKNGKNLLFFEVIKKYVEKFINFEIKEVSEGNKIIILELERDITVNFSSNKIPFKLNLTGKIDRIDLYNDELRIIDYKTGLVSSSDLKIIDFNALITDYKYNKAFQVLLYAYMLNIEKQHPRVQAGIISLKNLKPGFMPFAIKETDAARSKTFPWITQETLSLFEEQLTNLILEIVNPEVPFIEKETEPYGKN